MADESFRDAVRDALKARVAEQNIDADEPLPDALGRTLTGPGHKSGEQVSDDPRTRAQRLEAALNRPRPTERNRP